jgi:thiol-disulfide isomerase/thioredoxin
LWVIAGCTQAEVATTSKAPPAANIKSERTSQSNTEATAAKKRSAAAASPDAADGQSPQTSSQSLDLTIPEGDADKLLAFLRKLDQFRADDDSPQAVAEFVKVQKTILAAADALVATKDLKEDTRLEALVKKWNASFLLFSLDDPGAEERFLAIANELAKDKNALLARSARGQLRQFEIQRSLGALLQGTSRRTDKLVEDLHLLLGDDKPAFDSFDLAQKSARVLESLEKYAEARQIYAAIAKAFGKSESAELAEAAELTAQKASTRLEWIGKQAELAGKKLNGEPYDLAEERGKVVLVDFWATWCGPCIAELPNVVENYKKYHDRGFEVVGVSLDDNKGALDEFLVKKDIPWSTLWTAEIAEKIVDDPFQHPLAQKYGVDGIPATFLVDQQGKVVSLGIRGERLGEKLAELLGEPDEDSGGRSKD